MSEPGMSTGMGSNAGASVQEPPVPTDEIHDVPLSFPLSVVFASDWGVGTGTGVAGGVRSVIERDRRGLPVVRGTVLAGAVREQAALVAQALDAADTPEDAPQKGGWRRFTEALFGTNENPRLVTFSDAAIARDPSTGGELSEDMVHEVVSLKIDDRTGAAEEDHLRFLERARACTLSGQVELVSIDPHGRPITWDGQQRRAARLVLTLSALLVRAIGSHRTDGDGECTVLLGEEIEDGAPDLVQKRAQRQAREVRTQCRAWLREKWAQTAPQVPAPRGDDAQRLASTPHLPGRGLQHRQDKDVRASAEGAPPETTYRQANLDITLDTPVISYETPMFNEVRSLDFLRGTALLPLVHRRLRQKLDSPLVRDAVVTGDLLVSDARAVVDDILGLPVPLVLSRPKIERDTPGETPPAVLAEATGTEEAGQSGTTGAAQESRLLHVTNRLLAPEPPDVHTPIRSGYLFLPDLPGGSPARPSPDPQAVSRTDDVIGAIGAPALVGRQSIALDPLTGAAGEGQLFLVRALPEGLRMRATVTMSERLYREVQNHLPDAFPQESFPERIGSWRLSGTYGRATCHLGGFDPVEPPQATWSKEAAGTRLWTTLWFTSDVLVRSPALGPGGRLRDLLTALRRAGARVRLADEGCRDDRDRSRFSAGVRHRRVDSWAAADKQPRATRTAIQAGSVLKVSPAEDADEKAAMAALTRLSVTGVGELTAQGFGRFVVDHWLLESKNKELRLSRLCAAAFTASAGSSSTGTNTARSETATARTEKSQ
ncbi:RAMP superfamily CRISPR-associated protein [Actinomyces wuliandei]|uniref:RAMP superfamily CRISPR-associated protein n=1 Tax=Actinomyces wuliandei TaxID=2057743 RepID=UPI000FD884FC|nr:RAMP superfamily CRISPR-associated protein [Actinomyces wuliandei]